MKNSTPHPLEIPGGSLAPVGPTPGPPVRPSPVATPRTARVLLGLCLAVGALPLVVLAVALVA